MNMRSYAFRYCVSRHRPQRPVCVQTCQFACPFPTLPSLPPSPLSLPSPSSPPSPPSLPSKLLSSLPLVSLSIFRAATHPPLPPSLAGFGFLANSISILPHVLFGLHYQRQHPRLFGRSEESEDSSQKAASGLRQVSCRGPYAWTLSTHAHQAAGDNGSISHTSNVYLVRI